MAGRTPPGRAGRTWLAARLELATRAVELLEQKQQLLGRQHRRLTELVAGTREEWLARAAAAERANVRALVSGGREELRRTEQVIAPAQLRVGWTAEAGVSYPDTTSVGFAPSPTFAAPALSVAAATGASALEAAARHAAAGAALRLVEVELQLTVRRLRAIRNRWIPRLEAQLAQLDLRLDDGEREEATRLRWADRPVMQTRQV